MLLSAKVVIVARTVILHFFSRTNILNSTQPDFSRSARPPATWAAQVATHYMIFGLTIADLRRFPNQYEVMITLEKLYW